MADAIDTSTAVMASEFASRGLVVCSLEPWDDVWRRNQFLVNELVRRRPGLEVLFVEPAYDIVHSLVRRERPPALRPGLVAGSERVYRLRPIKPMPRALGPAGDAALRAQVRIWAGRLGFREPTLWINDVVYAGLAARTGWPTLYDITDDWLVEESVPARVRHRRRGFEERLLDLADEVVVCSPALAESRGRARSVTLIPNGVDVNHLTHPQERPGDLGRSPVAVYVGTLHDERLDVALVTELAIQRPDLTITLVGPNALSSDSRVALAAFPNVRAVGPRPYSVVPGYLQHADVVVVPHRINPFTESLDPIKAYECLAVGRPTVATAVAGFRGLPRPVTVASREMFVEAVNSALTSAPSTERTLPANATWTARGLEFEVALLNSRASHRRRQGTT
jgi:teichuronic acid biosynthesis glycosyltransferase TuaH